MYKLITFRVQENKDHLVEKNRIMEPMKIV
jgi:hypothetical protein